MSKMHFLEPQQIALILIVMPGSPGAAQFPVGP